jgi:anthranilate/para-aminobenzoate synthase component I
MAASAEAVFLSCFATDPHAFWLDSARVRRTRAGPTVCTDSHLSMGRGQVEPGLSRFSYMGGSDGPARHAVHAQPCTHPLADVGQVGECSYVLTYTAADRTARLSAPATSLLPPPHTAVPLAAGTDLLALMDSLAAPYHVAPASVSVPVPWVGGWVGYLGYELLRPRAATTPAPTAQLVWADRLLAWDHAAGHVYVISLRHAAHPALSAANEAWTSAVAARLVSLPPDSPALPLDRDGTRLAGSLAVLVHADGVGHFTEVGAAREAVEQRLRAQRSDTSQDDLLLCPRVRAPRDAYVAAVRSALAAIRQGETYEVCLTTALTHRLPRPVPSPALPGHTQSITHTVHLHIPYMHRHTRTAHAHTHKASSTRHTHTHKASSTRHTHTRKASST